MAEQPVSAIESGLLILLGVEEGDTKAECDRLACKIAALRIFEEDAGKMTRPLV